MFTTFERIASLSVGQDVVVFAVGDKAGPASKPSVNPQIAISKPAITAEEPLLAELTSFLDAVRRRAPPVVSLEEGRRALSLALDILRAIGEHSGRLEMGNL